MAQFIEERVIFAQRFQARTLDFRGKLSFTRYDECEFVKCAILIDDQTEYLAFTRCTFEDCNISELATDGGRLLMAKDNTFKLPIEMRDADLNKRLSQALADRF